MKFTAHGIGWMSWEVIDVGGTFTVTLSDAFDPFWVLHEFFHKVKAGKDADVTIDQEGTESRLSLKYVDFPNKWPFERGQNATLSIAQTIFPTGEKILKELPISAQEFVDEYIRALSELVDNRAFEGWRETDLFLDEFKALKAAKAAYPRPPAAGDGKPSSDN